MPFFLVVVVVAALLRVFMPAEEQLSVPVQETGTLG